MNDILRPGAGVLFMKVGTHAQESLDDIISRKSREIDSLGYAMWGYGGSTCHPSTMVRPFAESFAERGRPIHLVMEKVHSKHFAEPLSAAEYSEDGRTWNSIPNEISVRGSRYALVIDGLQSVDFLLPLTSTRVPLGPSNGRLGSHYVTGRVDKACLELLGPTEQEVPSDPTSRTIQLVARLRTPYAVFLRNYRR